MGDCMVNRWGVEVYHCCKDCCKWDAVREYMDGLSGVCRERKDWVYVSKDELEIENGCEWFVRSRESQARVKAANEWAKMRMGYKRKYMPKSWRGDGKKELL